ncbi:TDT family transporter [Streptomyces avicenniae]|uniref:TDT family transporter n=1 Tax=Streptomyces avicenniae TaxID=500153 RepID=UPI00069A893C|nr:TDT family transporter [Streptomyces avicenniae]
MPHRSPRPARDLPRHLAPNWYASVMGTGIVAVAAVTLPVHVPGLRAAATVVWALAAALLVALTALAAVHGRRRAAAHADHPVMAHFWGAPPMALMTVGAGTLTLGSDWIGARAAVAVATALWCAGTALGLLVAVAIPLRAVTRHAVAPDAAFGGWLMPVVPPMVSAATGALLVPHAPAGQVRLTLLLGCYALFGVSLLAALLVTAQLWDRLTHHGPGPAGMVPTLWIVLGPLGQSVTAANALGDAARHVLPGPYATGAEVFGLLYGLPVWGFAMLWLALAATLTARTARTARGGLPFSLTWWSFTFPLGTCVTGTSALAARTGATAFEAAAVALYAALVCAWATVATRTARAAARGTLFPAPTPTPPPARSRVDGPLGVRAERQLTARQSGGSGTW